MLFSLPDNGVIIDVDVLRRVEMELDSEESNSAGRKAEVIRSGERGHPPGAARGTQLQSARRTVRPTDK